MPFCQSDQIRYYTFSSLDDAGVIHAVFTRRGGLSPAPWSSLNVGGLLGDDLERVYQNRVLSFRAVGRVPETVYDTWQVHGTGVICAQAPRPRQMSHLRADAILTDRPVVSLFARFADCVPILLYDPARKVVGIAHAGWLGTVKEITVRAIETMKAVYGTQPGDVLAAIGPSIGAHHYQVGMEVVSQVKERFGQDAAALLSEQDGRVYFDLWLANRLLLNGAGVRQIEVARICTACHIEDWYSHREEKGQTGRFGVLIALKNH